MAAHYPHPDWYHNFPASPGPELTGTEEPEVAVEPLAVDEGAVSSRFGYGEADDDVGNLNPLEHHANVEQHVEVEYHGHVGSVFRAERHQDVAGGHNDIEVDLSYPGRGRSSYRELLEERPNKLQYTHTCVCALGRRTACAARGTLRRTRNTWVAQSMRPAAS